MSNKPVILFSEMIPEPEWEERFNHWYDTEHVPVRMVLPGFRVTRRYKEMGKMKYLVIYEMDGPEAMQTEGYQRVKNEPSEETRWMLSNVGGFTRYICREIGVHGKGDSSPAADPFDSRYIFTVTFKVPEDREAEFNEWYEVDHIPILLKNKDWLACRRYRFLSGEPGEWTHLAVHYVNDLAALESPEREEARNTPWRAKLAEEPWFQGTYMVLEKLGTFPSSYGEEG